MKGLISIPTHKKLASVYYKLQLARVQTEKNITLYSQWVRLDARLGEILIAYIAKYWKAHHPILLNKCIKTQIWPSVFGVLLEQTKLYFSTNKTNDDLLLFKSWSECVMCGIEPASQELFFFDAYSIGSSLFYQEASHFTKIYRKWGYLGKDLMLNKTISTGKTLMSSQQRKTILEGLIQKRKAITVNDYLSELNFQVHRKQAQMDLKEHKKLKPKGHTRNRIYFVVK